MAPPQVVLHVVRILEGLGALRTGHGLVVPGVAGANMLGEIEPGDEGVAVGTRHPSACNTSINSKKWLQFPENLQIKTKGRDEREDKCGRVGILLKIY